LFCFCACLFVCSFEFQDFVSKAVIVLSNPEVSESGSVFNISGNGFPTLSEAMNLIEKNIEISVEQVPEEEWKKCLEGMNFDSFPYIKLLVPIMKKIDLSHKKERKIFTNQEAMRTLAKVGIQWASERCGMFIIVN